VVKKNCNFNSKILDTDWKNKCFDFITVSGFLFAKNHQNNCVIFIFEVVNDSKLIKLAEVFVIFQYNRDA